ncbi:putative NADPH-dependent methylglyoxal reductase GRP2 [Daldinia childiae]|uniref:putative NADPH-dependent methylglyoxal reductase GRP2 n=1 Tax=Daldinia childiae TaxID=326645 RepID=UPI0014476650|nr:putative NADPH-dependent methylglyoxal reductase GRP2 [Daldinia childiae]KAF3054804.1 putative NADPH-dependent methylglyoxal reductase GRP2 [Daldinia childiae]
MADSAKLTKGVVLVTGGSGFIASHIIDELLDNGFKVVTTARSDEKGRRIVESASPAQRNKLSYIIVGDVAKENAFDSAFTQGTVFDYVVHTASPFHLNVQDPIKDFLDPAIKGTIGILKSIAAYAPTVKRVVITSSSAAMINPLNHPKVYDETCWAPWTLEDAKDPNRAYVVSKTLSEKAAWAFMETERPKFDLVVINCTYTFGPVQRNLPSLDVMNTSNHRIRDMLQGKMKKDMSAVTPVLTFVDVRDVARAHLKAVTAPEAGGNRIYIVGGHFSNKRIVELIRKSYPAFEALLPPRDIPDDFPDDVFGFDNGKSKRVLELEYTSLEKCVRDTVQSILDLNLGL